MKQYKLLIPDFPKLTAFLPTTQIHRNHPLAQHKYVDSMIQVHHHTLFLSEKNRLHQDAQHMTSKYQSLNTTIDFSCFTNKKMYLCTSDPLKSSKHSSFTLESCSTNSRLMCYSIPLLIVCNRPYRLYTIHRNGASNIYFINSI